MDCPECGGSLAAYALRGREASVCERCGWVGIEADHRGEAASTESWDDALSRFYDRYVETERRRADLPSVAAPDPAREAAAADGEGDDPTRDGTERGDAGPADGTAEDGAGDDADDGDVAEDDTTAVDGRDSTDRDGGREQDGAQDRDEGRDENGDREQGRDRGRREA